MVIVKFLGPINKEQLQVSISNLNELSEILKQDEELVKWLDISAIAINDVLVDNVNYSLNSGDIISILPPVCGG